LGAVLCVNLRPPDFERAEVSLRQAVGEDSSNAHALLLLAQLLNKGPQRDTALVSRLFRKSKEHDPHWEFASLVGRAKSAWETHNDKLALELYRQVWAQDSSDVTVGLRIALLAPDRDATVAMLRRCYALDSMHHNVNLNLGIQYSNAARDEADRRRALFHLDRAYATDPYDPQTLVELGVTLVELRDWVRGKEVLERLLKLDPDNHVGHGYLGTIAMYTGQRDQAIHHYEQSLLTDPDDPIVCGNLATLFAQDKRWADARSLLRRALKGMPDAPELHMSMCDVLINEQ
jgi:tetratricopeptide (TPR) repeat protein